MKNIAVVILNYKGWKDTIDCVESLQSQTYSHFRIIIVDNFSNDESVKKIKEWINGDLIPSSEYFVHRPITSKKKIIEYDTKTGILGGDPIIELELNNLTSSNGIVLIENIENLGFSGGNNVGAKYAALRGFDYTLLLNNDTIVVDKDFLAKLILPFDIEKDVFLTGPNIINYDSTFDSPIIEDSFLGNLFYLSLKNYFRRKLDCPSIYIDIKAISSPKPVAVYKVSGACMMFKTNRLEEIGFLDENVWLSSEEAILSEKIKNKKGKIIFQPLTTLIHKKAQAPRPKSDKYSILKNHYKQRDYFNRNYRNYNALQLSLIGLMNKFRLILIRIGR